jgi:hypothetical protein
MIKDSKLLVSILVLALAIGAIYFLLRFAPSPGRVSYTSDQIEPARIMDGQVIQWLGTYRASSAEGGVKSYASTTLGVAFEYPAGYLLFTREDDAWTNAYASIVLAPATSTLESIARADAGFGGEGPGIISIQFFEKPGIPFSLEDWLRTHTNYTNFDPANDPAIQLASTTVAGISALTYQTSLGLEALNYRIFVQGGRIVLISAPADYENDLEFVLGHLQFTADRGGGDE